MPKPVAVTLLSKPGCHLCDDARTTIEQVLADFTGRGIPVAFDEVDILGDPKLARLHAEEIPVVFVNGRRHAIWRVDPARFTAALEKQSGARGLRLRAVAGTAEARGRAPRSTPEHEEKP